MVQQDDRFCKRPFGGLKQKRHKHLQYSYEYSYEYCNSIPTVLYSYCTAAAASALQGLRAAGCARA